MPDPPFQFHYGSIKGISSPSFSPEVSSCFNSTMVRLKVEEGNKAGYRRGCFNSTMVRLKAFVYNLDPETYLFQFHYGSIKG